MKTFGERLKVERQRLHLTQERMAEVGGVRKNTQCLYEAGRSAPDSVYLQRLQEIGLDITFLFYGERNRTTLGPVEQALFTMYESWPPPVRTMLFAGISLLHNIHQAQADGVDEAKFMQAVQFMQNFLNMDEEEKQEMEARVRQLRATERREPPPLR
jgi:transcriptional regulator with XRE-family HTH domain